MSDVAIHARSQRLVAVAALVATVLVLVVTASSAWLRLAHSGLGCADWPACYGAFRETLITAPTPQLGAVRTTHRVAAGTAGLAILFGGVLWLSGARTARGVTAIVLMLFALTAALSVLGRHTPGSRLPAVALGNMFGGMVLLALAWTWYVALRCQVPGSIRYPSRVPALLGLLLIVLQILVGGLVSTQYAALACTTFPDCLGSWWPTTWSWQAFNPMQRLGELGADLALAMRQALHMVHRYGALLTVAGVTILTVLAFRYDRALRQQGVTLFVLMIAQCLLGVAMILLSPQLVLTVAHDVVAALILAAACGLTWCICSGKT